VTDYSGKTDDELKLLMRERGLGLRGRCKTAHYIKALQAPGRQGCEQYQTRKGRVEVELQYHHERGVVIQVADQALAEVSLQRHKRVQELSKRQDLMFASKYDAESTRMSFLDLLPDIRNTTYELGLYDGDQNSVIKLSYLLDKDRFSRSTENIYAAPDPTKGTSYLL
jgi:hypothetical protein